VRQLEGDLNRGSASRASWAEPRAHWPGGDRTLPASGGAIIGVARFRRAARGPSLQRHGLETIRCDLLDEEAVQRLAERPERSLPGGMKVWRDWAGVAHLGR